MHTAITTPMMIASRLLRVLIIANTLLIPGIVPLKGTGQQWEQVGGRSY